MRGGRFRRGELCPVEERHQAGTVLFGDDTADFVQPGDQVVEDREDGWGVVPAYVGPDRR